MRIATHDGRHHCDDAAGVAMWCMLLGTEQVQVARTTSDTALAMADCLVDVGGRYDAKRLQFDHHGLRLRRPNGMPYAAAGLVWKHCGEKICSNQLDALESRTWKLLYDNMNSGRPRFLELAARLVCEEVDQQLIVGIDAWDNGLFPEMRSHAIPFIPVQRMVHLLSFTEAVELMGRAIQDQIHRCARVLAAGNLLRLAWEGRVSRDRVMFHDMPVDGGYLVEVAGLTVPLRVLSQQARGLPGRVCYGVLSPIRDCTRWALHATGSLARFVPIPRGVITNNSRDRFFAEDRQQLLDFACGWRADDLGFHGVCSEADD